METAEAQKKTLLQDLRRAHARFVAASASAPALEGPWGVREMLLHVAAWEAEAMARIPQLLAGAPEKTYDVDAFNACAVARAAEQSSQEARDELERIHTAFMHLLDHLDASTFLPIGTAHEWVVAQARHNDEHASELEAREGSWHENA